MLFKKKNKEINIINFGKGYWGNDIVYDKNISKRVSKMHGWYDNNFILCSKSKPKLQVGSLVIKETNQGFWYGRIKKLEWCEDPRDMFFATVKTIYKDKMLSKEEIKYLEENELVNV